MVDNLLPESTQKLRERFKSRFAERPLLLHVLEGILNDVDELWGEQGIRPEAAKSLDSQLLPVLLEVANVPSVGPASPAEGLVAQALEEWRRLDSTLEY